MTASREVLREMIEQQIQIGKMYWVQTPLRARIPWDRGSGEAGLRLAELRTDCGRIRLLPFEQTGEDFMLVSIWHMEERGKKKCNWGPMLCVCVDVGDCQIIEEAKP